jgi:predicted ester cyclase
MSTESSRQFIERYIRAIRQSKSQADIDQFISDEPLKEHIAMFESSFPGYDLEVEDMIAEGDKVVLRATFHGVHGGEMQGMPATGRRVSVPLIIIYRIAGDKIVEHWMNVDELGLLRQLGAAPVPA